MIELVSKHWIRAQTVGPFFSPETVRFFNSRMADTGKRSVRVRHHRLTDIKRAAWLLDQLEETIARGEAKRVA